MAAPPAVEPPGLRLVFHGLREMPVSGESPTPFQPNSGMVVLPSKIAPASRKRATAGASESEGVVGVTADPRRLGQSLTLRLSLMVTPTPSSRP